MEKGLHGFLGALKDWNRENNIPDPGCFTPLSVERAGLRHRLMAEENDEYLEAVRGNDRTGIFDALIDKLYILTGTMAEHGITEKMLKEGFDEVHRSNMSKFCATLVEAERTIDLYYTGKHPDKPGQEWDDRYGLRAEKTPAGNYAVVRSDGKVMKSHCYTPARLETLLRPD